MSQKITGMSTRKFHRAVFEIEVLSEEPFDPQMAVGDVIEAATSGDDSMRILKEEYTEIDGQTAARLLKEQGSDPEFFGLTEEGEDLDEDS